MDILLGIAHSYAIVAVPSLVLAYVALWLW